MEDLSRIAQAVTLWHRRVSMADPTATVPSSLNALVRDGDLTGDIISDPVTHVQFSYRPLVGNRYELCADFTSSSSAPGAAPIHSSFWHYGKGHTCFVLDATEPAPW